jgi:hypothetical protein
VIGHRWNESAYLFSMACRPLNIPSDATKIPSSVKSAAMALASFFLNASSNFRLTAPKSSIALATPSRSRCWTHCRSTPSFCWAMTGTANQMANPARVTSKSIFIIRLLRLFNRSLIHRMYFSGSSKFRIFQVSPSWATLASCLLWRH